MRKSEFFSEEIIKKKIEELEFGQTDDKMCSSIYWLLKMKLSQYEQTIFTNVSTVIWGEPAKKGQYKCQATTCEVFGKESVPLLPNCTCLWAYSRLKNFRLASGKPFPNGKWFLAFSLWISPCSFILKECRNLIHPRSISTEVKGTDHQICFFHAE